MTDHAAIAAGTTVMPMADAVAMIPVSEGPL
jgi:hypothetical protein